jgi:hypothetical protein
MWVLMPRWLVRQLHRLSDLESPRVRIGGQQTPVR